MLALVVYMGNWLEVSWPLQKRRAASGQLQVPRGASSDSHGCVAEVGTVSASSAVHQGHLEGTYIVLVGFRSTIGKRLYLAWLCFVQECF